MVQGLLTRITKALLLVVFILIIGFIKECGNLPLLGLIKIAQISVYQFKLEANNKRILSESLRVAAQPVWNLKGGSTRQDSVSVSPL